MRSRDAVEVRPYRQPGTPGTLHYHNDKLLRVKEPPQAPYIILTLQELRRHNSLQPELQPTNRIFLRWAAGSGTGLYNPDAEPRRESHMSRLGDAEHKLVDQMIIDSPWETLIRAWYRTEIDTQQLAK